MGKFGGDYSAVEQSGVLEHESGNISETRKDRGKDTMEAYRNLSTFCRTVGTIPDHLRPPLLQDWFATPTQNSNRKFRVNECT